MPRHSADLFSHSVRASSLSPSRFLIIVSIMEVHFPAETQAQLNQLAASQGIAAAQLVEETIVRVLQRQAQFNEGLDQGISAADRGDLIEHAEVVERIDRLFRS